MEKQEFLKQMIEFGQKLLAEEQRPKINIKAQTLMKEIFSGLEEAINAAAALELEFISAKDKRAVKARKVVALLMQCQELMNPLAEDDDIQLI